MRSPARRRCAGSGSQESGARGASIRGPGARGTAGRTRRPTSPACRGGSTRDSPVPESAAAQRRVLPASPPLGFFLDDGHGHADQAVELFGAGLGKDAFAPRTLAPPECVEKASEEREQRDALQLDVPAAMARCALPTGAGGAAMAGAPLVLREGGADLCHSCVDIGER